MITEKRKGNRDSAVVPFVEMNEHQEPTMEEIKAEDRYGFIKKVKLEDVGQKDFKTDSRTSAEFEDITNINTLKSNIASLESKNKWSTNCDTKTANHDLTSDLRFDQVAVAKRIKLEKDESTPSLSEQVTVWQSQTDPEFEQKSFNLNEIKAESEQESKNLNELDSTKNDLSTSCGTKTVKHDFTSDPIFIELAPTKRIK